MIGNIKGWLIPSSIHPIAFAMGSIVKKPGLIGDRIETREYLPLTVLIDHDVVDGAPAARFLSRLTEIVETGNSII
jgi:pyruvate/2-oxoglutarate dehydrogenase complex dihydrolipoamide acyltransferase (E2) component